jgi:hypothetical protein
VNLIDRPTSNRPTSNRPTLRAARLVPALLAALTGGALTLGCDTPAEYEAFMSSVEAEGTDPTWVSPLGDEPLPAGEPIELAVAVANAKARAVRFTVDGKEIAVCDPSQPEADCKRDDVWRWTTKFAPGRHTIAASFVVNGVTHEATRQIEVEPLASFNDRVVKLQAAEALAEKQAAAQLDAELDTDASTEARAAAAAAPSRGKLDPNRPFHRVCGGQEWKVQGQRVSLRRSTPTGAVSAITTCMRRYGTFIKRQADRYKVSRASVVATAITESNCTNPAGSGDGLSSGPMQVTGSTCAALTDLSPSACKRKMHAEPEFSFSVGARYMGSAYQKRQHAFDPPKIAAAYNAGSVRCATTNAWRMRSTGNHIDRFVKAYNAYRAWEIQTTPRAGAAAEVAVADVDLDADADLDVAAE